MTHPTKAICPILLVSVGREGERGKRKKDRGRWRGREDGRKLRKGKERRGGKGKNRGRRKPRKEEGGRKERGRDAIGYYTFVQEDYRKITVEKKGEVNFFTSQMIKDCMRKVITVNLHQTIKVRQCAFGLPEEFGVYVCHQVAKDLEIKAYYAGHVLGAAMFLIRVGDQSVVYTVRWRDPRFSAESSFCVCTYREITT